VIEYLIRKVEFQDLCTEVAEVMGSLGARTLSPSRSAARWRKHDSGDRCRLASPFIV
jgi:hypothetical protein